MTFSLRKTKYIYQRGKCARLVKHFPTFSPLRFFFLSLLSNFHYVIQYFQNPKLRFFQNTTSPVFSNSAKVAFPKFRKCCNYKIPQMLYFLKIRKCCIFKKIRKIFSIFKRKSTEFRIQRKLKNGSDYTLVRTLQSKYYFLFFLS